MYLSLKVNVLCLRMKSIKIGIDVTLCAVFVEEGSASGHLVSMRNVGVKRNYIHRS